MTREESHKRAMDWWNGNKPDVQSNCDCEDCKYNQSIIDHIEGALKNASSSTKSA